MRLFRQPNATWACGRTSRMLRATIWDWIWASNPPQNTHNQLPDGRLSRPSTPERRLVMGRYASARGYLPRRPTIDHVEATRPISASCDHRADFGPWISGGAQPSTRSSTCLRGLTRSNVCSRRDHFFLISLVNHAFASFQSRMTVCGETAKTSALSSTLRPPKKRNSTTRALRISIRAKASNAS